MLQPNLETLKINVREESVHKFVPTRALSFLRKLKSFEISYGTIAELQPYAFANLTTLQVCSKNIFGIYVFF